MQRLTRQVFVDVSPDESKVFLVRPARRQKAWIVSEADGPWVGRYKTLGLALGHLEGLQSPHSPRPRPEVFTLPG
jgi:hypothetical protein